MDTTAATIELRPTANSSQFTRTHVVAETTESPSLSLRPLKKHTNIRIGKNVDLAEYPSKSSLFTISNKHGWFFAGNERSVIASPLSELRTALGQSNTDEEVTFMSQVKLHLGSHIPLFISLAAGENILVVASRSMITTWDVTAVLNGQIYPSNSMDLDGLVIVDVQPNPGDNPELVAVLTTGQSPDSPRVLVLFNCITNTELVRWSGLMNQGTAPVAVSWSTRGKQIAIATSGGDILQYSPAEPATAKATIPQARGPSLAGTIPIMLQWLSNYTFYVVYAEPKLDASSEEYQPDQHNYVLTYDKRNNHVTDTNIPLPWDPYGLAREPGHQTKLLRGWGRFKHLIFVNDAHASDVGIVACIGDASSSDESGTWSKLSFEDGSITFPLTADMDDTSLIGMDMDLSADTSLLGANQANGDDPTIPPAPILYLLTNDAVVVAFHVVSEDGLPYPGMAHAINSATADQGMEMSMEKAPAPAQPAPAPSAFGSSAGTAPSFGQSGFGFGASVAPKFGSSGFGSTPAVSPFAAAAAASQTTGPSLGFGAFAGAKPAFGQSSFGAPSAPSSSATNPSQTTTSSGFGGGFAAFAGSKPAFGQSSFGAPSTQFSNQTPSPFGSSASASSPFGQAAAAASLATPVSPSAEPSSGPSPAPQAGPQTSGQTTPAETAFKPASGFGAFSKLNTGGGSFGTFSNPKPVDPQAKPLAFAGFGAPSATSTPASATPAFGTPTALGQPKFGQSTLGTPAFGQSAFGKSGFGSAPAKSPFATAAAAAPSSTSSSGGGFGAFASTPASFAALAKTAESKPGAHLGLPPGTSETPKPTAPVKTPSGPKSFFGSNAAVSQPGFATKGLRDSVSKDDDDDETDKTGDRFPEEEADKLEPETTYEGPGLFGPPSGKGKPTQGLGGLGLKDAGNSSSTPKLDAAKSIQAFGQKIDPSNAALSAAAAFKPSSSTLKPTVEKGGQGTTTQARVSAAAPVSAFSFGANTTPAGSPEKQSKSDDEDSSEGSIEVEDDVNEFLEGESFEGVDAPDGEEDEEGDEEEDEEDAEDDEEEEEGEEEGDEDEEDALSDPPEEGDESADEEPQKSNNKLAQSVKQPAVPPLFNPFGRLGAARPGSSGEQKPTSPAPAPSSPSLLGRIDKTSAAREPPASPSPSVSAPRPQPIVQPVGTPISSVQPKAKPRPASPKAAFGSWAPSATPKGGVDTSKPSRPQTPPGLFGKLSSTQPGGSISKLNPATATPSSSTEREPTAKPVPEVQAIQPVHPELQAQLDRVLNEYSAILYHINERAKKAKASFEAFKGTGPAVGDEFQASYEWSGQNTATLKRTLDLMDGTAKTVWDRTSKLQRQLDDLSSSTLRLEMKKEEASRYLRALQNPDFVEKFITPRSLGPEHTENQTKLRKGLKAQRTRVTELEEQVQTLKKKVDKFKAGELSIDQLDLDKIRKIHQNTEWFTSDLTTRLEALTVKVDALPKHAMIKQPRRLSSSGAHNTISRSSSFGPDIIATTAETFTAEVKMTKLSELMVEARTAAPINRIKSSSVTPSKRKTPFTAKPIVLRELVTARTALLQQASANQSPQTRLSPGVAQFQPSNVPAPPPQVPPSLPSSSIAPPSKTPPVDQNRRTPAINRPHSRAPPISRGGPVHTSSFSFGPPPPAANAVKLPTNFVSLTSMQGKQ